MNDIDLDPVAASVAAYAPHVQQYAAHNANHAGDLLERFCAGLSPEHDVILDAGCGPGRDLVRFAERGHCAVGVDLSPEMLAVASEATDGWPVRLEQADLRDLPFDDDTFAGVWACASLVHLPASDAVAALAEIARVARPGAPVHVSVKTGGVTGFADTVHGRRFFRHWDHNELRNAAAGVGLTVEEIEPDGAFVNLWATAR